MSQLSWADLLVAALLMCMGGCDVNAPSPSTERRDACSAEVAATQGTGETLAADARARAPETCTHLRDRVTAMMSAAGEAMLAETAAADRDAVSANLRARIGSVQAVFLDACGERSAAQLDCLSRAGPYTAAYVQAFEEISRCIARGDGDRARCEARSMMIAERERRALGECAPALRVLLTEVKRAAEGS